jgi:hypothetical protein
MLTPLTSQVNGILSQNKDVSEGTQDSKIQGFRGFRQKRIESVRTKFLSISSCEEKPNDSVKSAACLNRIFLMRIMAGIRKMTYLC